MRLIYPSLQAPPPFTGGEVIGADKWIYRWSEPVRTKRIHVSRIVSGLTWNPQQPLPPTSIWFRPLSEPVRLKVGLRARYHPYSTQDTDFIPKPNALFGSWYPPLTEPVRQRIWLKAPYDPDFFYHPRVLPTPDVLVTMDTTEINGDVYMIGVQVSDAADTAVVSIEEIPAGNDAGLSIREP